MIMTSADALTVSAIGSRHWSVVNLIEFYDFDFTTRVNSHLNLLFLKNDCSVIGLNLANLFGSFGGDLRVLL